MDVPEVSIITRCRNRLEYTVQVLDAVRRRTHIPYEHIIIDNASTDGTKQWFTWMAENTRYYDGTLKYVYMNRNCGDWGGMLTGAKIARGEYIVQLDNDIIPCDGWLNDLKTALLNTPYHVIMLKRANVFGKWILRPLNAPINVNGLEVAKVERAVACYMMSKKDFDSLNISESQGMRSKYLMASKLSIGKILNRTCYELEATKYLVDAGMDQRSKYSPKNPQIWEKV